MSFTTGRTVRLSALALATGTLVATAATGASASAAKPDSPLLSYAGNAGSTVVALKLNLPLTSDLAPTVGELTSSLGLSNPIGSDGSIGLSLLNQTGSLSHDASGDAPDLSTSVSNLAGDSLGATLTSAQQKLGIVLNQTITSTLKDPGTKKSDQALADLTSNLPAQLKALLNLNVPGLQVSTDAKTLATAGKSEVAGVDLGKVSDALPSATLTAIETQVNAIVAQLQTLSTSASNSLGTALTGTLGTLGGLTGSLPIVGGTVNTTVNSLSSEVTSVQALLTSLTGELQGIVTSIEDGSIISLKGLTTTHSVSFVNGQQVSTIENDLANLSILGGLVNLKGFQNSVSTYAGGTAGTSKVIAHPNLAEVQFGRNNELGVVLGQTSALTGQVAQILKGTGLPVDLTGALNGLYAQLTSLTTNLNSILQIAGVTITADSVTTNDASKDGSRAVAALSGLNITVDPLSKLPIGALAQRGSAVAAPQDASAPLLRLTVGGLSASSAAAVVTPTRTVTTTTPTKTEKKLAYTGADLPLTGAVAVSLIAGGAALVIRRRRTGSEL